MTSPAPSAPSSPVSTVPSSPIGTTPAPITTSHPAPSSSSAVVTDSLSIGPPLMTSRVVSTSPAPHHLAETGNDVGILLLVGVSLVAIGTLILRRGRNTH